MIDQVLSGPTVTAIVDYDTAEKQRRRDRTGLLMADTAIRLDATGDLPEVLAALGIIDQPKPATPKPARDRGHGTDHGWWAHRHHAETPCQPCTDAHDVAMSEWAEARRAAANSRPEWLDYDDDWPVDTAKPAICGEAAGYMRHVHEDTRPCQPCHVAFYRIGQPASEVAA